LSDYDADVLVRLTNAAPYFEEMVRAGASARGASVWLQGEVRRRLKEIGEDDLAKMPIPAGALAELAVMTEQGVVSSSVAKDVFEKMWATGRRARAIVDAEGLGQIGDEAAVAAVVAEVLARHPDAVAQFRGGKQATFGFLVGQAMKASGGKANPNVVSEALRKALER
jgi:aspartyl-tRNA(Asn)/glutamyl-tRNA(Gln) amidotransferase subunit B